MDDETIVGAAPLPGGNLHVRPEPQPADPREALLERDLNDVYLLMDHLSGRPDRCISDITIANPADPAKPLLLIDEVCRIRWPLEKEAVAHATQASTLFKARDKLNQLANPANGATIAYTILVLGDDGEEGWLSRWRRRPDRPDQKTRIDLARKAYPNLARSAASFRGWITLLQAMLLGGLLLTSLLSWNVASGKLVLQRIAQLDEQAVDLGRTLNAGETPVPAGAPANAGGSESTDSSLTSNLPSYARFCYGRGRGDHGAAPTTDLAVRQQQTCETARLVLHRRAIADRDLDEWASYWSWLKHGAAWMHGEPAGTYDTTTANWPGEAPQVARGIASSNGRRT